MTQKDTPLTQSEQLLVREISLDALPAKGSHEKISADSDELKAIANDLGLVELTKLQATLEIHPWRAGLRVRGKLIAQVTQSCAITLVPVAESIEENIDRVFLPESEIEAPPTDEEGVIILDSEKDELPEVLVGPMFDLGQIVLEQLALEIDPYPKAPGAELGDVYQQENPEKESPFSALAGLKMNKKD